MSQLHTGEGKPLQQGAFSKASLPHRGKTHLKPGLVTTRSWLCHHRVNFKRPRKGHSAAGGKSLLSPLWGPWGPLEVIVSQGLGVSGLFRGVSPESCHTTASGDWGRLFGFKSRGSRPTQQGHEPDSDVGLGKVWVTCWSPTPGVTAESNP